MRADTSVYLDLLVAKAFDGLTDEGLAEGIDSLKTDGRTLLNRVLCAVGASAFNPGKGRDKQLRGLAPPTVAHILSIMEDERFKRLIGHAKSLK